MAYIPSATANRTTPEKDNRKTIYIILVGIILLLLGYIIYDKTQDNKTDKVLIIAQQALHDLDSSKNILKIEFDAASKQVDTLTANNTQLQTLFSERSIELAKIKSNFSSLLNNNKFTAEDLKKAKILIAEYKSQVEGLLAEVTRLNAENQTLTVNNQQLTTEKTKLTTDNEQLNTEKSKLTTDKKNLEEKVDVASTLTASHINITAIKLRGEKEKETETAKRANFFRVSFVLDENRITPSGSKLLYIIISNPEGKVLSVNGNFKLRNGIETQYTDKIDVSYEQGKVTPVSFDWKPGIVFEPGDYKIEIYNNGFKIGETKKSMKKGGLFS